MYLVSTWVTNLWLSAAANQMEKMQNVSFLKPTSCKELKYWEGFYQWTKCNTLYSGLKSNFIMPLISLEAKQILFPKMKYQKYQDLSVKCQITSCGQLPFLSTSRYFEVKNHSLDMLTGKKNLTTWRASYFHKVTMESQ